MEPTDDNLSGCPAWTFNQPDQEEDLMPSLFLLSDSPSSSLWLPLPPAEALAGPEDFGDWQISLDEMPCLPFSGLDEVPCIPAAVAEVETNYAAAPAPPAPLVATHGTGAGQFSSNFPPSSTTFVEFADEPCFPEEEVQEKIMSLQSLLDPPMALDGLPNTTNGDPAARSHADAVPLVLQQGTSTTTDELPHPQQQVSLVQVQIQQMTPTILPSQLSLPTPVLNPAWTPMGLQGTFTPAAPQDQEANILSTASTRSRPIKSRGLPSLLQDGSSNLFHMVIDMIRQFVRYIGKRMMDEQHRSVLQRFWRSHCKYCGTMTVICQYCNTVMRNPSIIELLRHLESCDNNIHLLPASSGTSKETQQSSQALLIKENAENPNGESEPIETENNNCATAAQVGTQGTNTGAQLNNKNSCSLLPCPKARDISTRESTETIFVLSQWQQHQLPMDREEHMATILSSQPCCQGCYPLFGGLVIAQPNSWWDLIIRLSDSSCCSSTTKSTHDGFRLKFSSNKETGCTIVYVHSSAAWVHVSENLYKYQDHAGVFLRTFSHTIGRSYLTLSVGANDYDWKSPPAWCPYPWRCMHIVLRSLGFRKEFATDFVKYALGWVDACNFRLRNPRSSDKGKGIIEEGDASSGKRKRESAPRQRSKVWNHFMKDVVMVEGSEVIVARCKYCSSVLKANPATHGTSHLKRHITSTHKDELAKSPL